MFKIKEEDMRNFLALVVYWVLAATFILFCCMIVEQIDVLEDAKSERALIKENIRLRVDYSLLEAKYNCLLGCLDHSGINVCN